MRIYICHVRKIHLSFHYRPLIQGTMVILRAYLKLTEESANSSRYLQSWVDRYPISKDQYL